jgi:class 3 adenylate cyclase
MPPKFNTPFFQVLLEINNNFRELKLKRDTISLSHQIHKRALDEVLENKEFESKLKGGQKHNNTFVVSIDIRRSTELMLKAKTPELFAQFITSMCSKLMEIVKTNGGIVDKFTGDGILAFFPEFFTGSDAGYHACKAATQAIETFQNLYVAHRASFKSVLSEVGLGVGIDFGDVYFSEMAGSLTVVGEAVVYACRMGAAPAGSIYLNQPAYEAILKTQYLPYLDFEEKCIEIKHEGKLLCHSVQLKFEEEQLKHIYSPQPPSWLKDL